MKILLIHNEYRQTGGEDVVVRHEGDLLAKHGHEVRRAIFDNSEIKSLLDRVLTGAFAIYNPLSARIIQKKVEQFDPDIIHVHNFTPLVSPAVFFVANRNRIPVVSTLHNFRLLCPSATLFHDNQIYEKSISSVFPWDAVRRGVYRNSRLETAAVASVTAFHNLLGTWRNRVDRFITPTGFAREKFRNSRLRIPEHKLVVKPSSVEQRGKGRPDREDFFLFVGRLTEEKGIRTLLRAFEISGSRLVVIGDGPLRKLVEGTASKYQRLAYLGFQDSDTVLKYVKSCQALVFPSVWYEGGTPLSILEAFSSGTLVVASRLGAMIEMIENGVNGLHFEAGNALDLAKKTAEVKRCPEDARRMAEGGYHSYLERYTPEKNYQQLMAIYRQVIGERQQIPQGAVFSAP